MIILIQIGHTNLKIHVIVKCFSNIKKIKILKSKSEVSKRLGSPDICSSVW